MQSIHWRILPFLQCYWHLYCPHLVNLTQNLPPGQTCWEWREMEILGEGIKKTAAISSLLSVQGIFWGLYIRPRLLLVTSSFYSHMATVLYQSITRNHFFFFAIVTVRLNKFFFFCLMLTSLISRTTKCLKLAHNSENSIFFFLNWSDT